MLITTQHAATQHAVLRDARFGDRRITRLPTAIRHLRHARKLAEVVQGVARGRHWTQSRGQSLDFHPDCGSGRARDWSRLSFSLYATAVADLVRRGYGRETAERIAEAVRVCICVDNRIAFDFDAPPPMDCPHRDTYGWAAHERAQQWSNWRHWIESQPSPRFGRRTQRFFAAAKRIMDAKRQSDLAVGAAS